MMFIGREKMLTMAECAKRTGYSLRTLNRLGQSGEFPPERVRIGNVRLFAVMDVNYFARMQLKNPRKRPRPGGKPRGRKPLAKR